PRLSSAPRTRRPCRTKRTASRRRLNATSSAAAPHRSKKEAARWAASSRQAASYSLVAGARIGPRCPGRADHRLELVEARQAAGMQLRIANRSAFRAHARLTESPVGLQQCVVVAALDHVPPRRPVPEIASAGLRAVGHEFVV